MRRAAWLLLVVLVGGCEGQDEAEMLRIGSKVYAAECASCHGKSLEGHPNWREKGINGRMPPPPHDDSGHTWRHTDRWLFHVVESGLVPPVARRGYESDMPAFGGKLTRSEIQAVLSYIKSTWSEETHRKRDAYLRTRRDEARSPGIVLEKAFRQGGDGLVPVYLNRIP